MKKIGPGFLIAAAFIGPGTVTTCIVAGAGFGLGLLWAVLLSALATMVLQEMAARLGVVTQQGLVESIKQAIPQKALRISVIFVVMIAILIGNAAYEGGNIGGATLGFEALFGTAGSSIYPYLIGASVFLLLNFGNYRFLEKAFLVLIGIMSLSFLITACLTRPDLSQLLRGMFVPGFSEESLLIITALVGTTIVPYNLFLHASLVKEKWKGAADLKSLRLDTLLSIGLGGLVSMSIVVAASAVPSNQIKDALGLAQALNPLFGDAARYFMGIGLFAAGITSSITAPLAASYVANSCFGWNANLRDYRFKMVWIIVLAIGVVSLSFGYKPIEIIKVAQIANGILLPVIAFLLVWISGKTSVLGRYANTKTTAILGYFIVVLAFVLGAKSIIKVFGWI